MAHAADLLGNLPKDEGEAARRKIALYDNEFAPNLMPKWLCHHISAVIVDRALGTSWTDLDGTFKTDRPVECRILNLSEALGPSPNQIHAMSDAQAKERFDSTFKTGSDTVAELRKIGAAAFLKTHSGFIQAEDGKLNKNKLINQVLICLPKSHPNEHRGEQVIGMPPPAKTVPDFEGAVRFLTYFLHKGWLVEKDIAPDDRCTFVFAKSPKYQNLVRSSLNEPLLPEETHGRGK